MAKSIKDFAAKADALQAAIDAEQAQVKTAIDTLTATNEELKAKIAEGGTEEELQAISDKFDSAIADLSSTIPDVVVEDGDTDQGGEIIEGGGTGETGGGTDQEEQA